jgi:hypothetical protein
MASGWYRCVGTSQVTHWYPSSDIFGLKGRPWKRSRALTWSIGLGSMLLVPAQRATPFWNKSSGMECKKVWLCCFVTVLGSCPVGRRQLVHFSGRTKRLRQRMRLGMRMYRGVRERCITSVEWRLSRYHILDRSYTSHPRRSCV